MERALQPLPRQFSLRREYTQCTDSQGAHEKYDHGKGTLRPWNLVLVSKILFTLLKTNISNIALENRPSPTRQIVSLPPYLRGFRCQRECTALVEKQQLRKRSSRITRPFWRLLAVTMIPMRRRFIDSWWPITFYEDWWEKDYMFIDDFEQTHSEWWLYNRILPRMTLFSDQCSQHYIFFTPQNFWIHT